MTRIFIAILLYAGILSACLRADPVPIVASYSMAPDPVDPLKLVDQSGTHETGALKGNAQFVSDPERGSVLKLADPDSFGEVRQYPLLDRLGQELTCTAWIKIDALPALHTSVSIISKCKQGSTPFELRVGDNGALGFKGDIGGEDTGLSSHPNQIHPGQWQHVAVTYKTGDQVFLYIDGKQAAHGTAVFPLQPSEQSLYLGTDNGKGQFMGMIGAVHLYAQALTADQIGQDISGSLEVRPATKDDMPQVLYRTKLTLGRFDMPVASTQGYGHIHQTAVRIPGPDAVDWPQMTLDGAPLFQTGDKAEQISFIRKRVGKEAMSKFEQDGDCIIEPGHHWLRPLAWRWGRNFVYTDDRYARSWVLDYELWVFPIEIQGPGPLDVHNVELKYRDQVLYHSDGPFHSLTLLLPANAPGTPYTLTVAGRPAVSFDVGLQPVELGHPKDIPIKVDLALNGSGPALTVKNLARPETFPQQADWDKDVAALASYQPVHLESPPTDASMQARLGLSVPRSPVTVNAISLPAGMSGGFFRNGQDGHGATHLFGGTPDDLAHYLADTGYDRDFEFTNLGDKLAPSDPKSMDSVFAALSRAGVQLGLVPGQGWFRPSINHANISIFAWTLPDFCQPLYRDIQMQTQRYSRYGNFAGICIGADNGSYVSYWNWAPPIPDRPWPTAMTAFFQGQPVKIPVSAASTDTMEAREYKASTVREVVDYIARYDKTFTDLGYFGNAMKEVDPAAHATCGMFGSSPGGLGRGGWPMGTVPGDLIFQDLDVQQAYDWNEFVSSKPLHNVALLDRLRSYDPHKPTWALIDDFTLLLDRGLRQRAYALALTRGIQAVGTTFLANPTGDRARPDVIADQKELYAWIHRYGGAYAMSEPDAAIGILYVHPQAILRSIVGGDDPDDATLLKGSHEGKTTEALFLCHAAGWPARIVTPQELKRGLNSGIKALLLVGLNQFDDSWVWSNGLTDSLKEFTVRGGRILLDDESVCPVPATSTGMQVRAYVAQSMLDSTPVLLARNADNIAKLQAAMKGIPTPVAVSTDPTVWAVPTWAGDTQYVTVVNQLMQNEPFRNFPQGHMVMKGQTGSLAWNTSRPIYDVRQGRRILPAEASKVDLTHDAFQWYALPPAEVSKPLIALSDDSEGYKQATVTMAGQGSMKGIPIEITVKRPGESVTLYTATGLTARLPVRSNDAFGVCEVTAKELLSGLSNTATLTTSGPSVPAPDTANVHVDRPADVNRFASRQEEPLTIALTDKQAADPDMKDWAEKLAAHYRASGRTVEVGRAEPNQVILSRQPYVSSQPYPQWKTAETDLVLFGSPNDNVLIMDQDRGVLLPSGIDNLKAGQAIVSLTFSPFVGECQVINLIAPDKDGLKAAVASLLQHKH